MKHLTILIALGLLILTTSCQKSTTTPVAPAPAQTMSTTNTSTLTSTESQLAGKWFYEKSETIGNGSVTSQFTYTTQLNFNSVEFKCTLCAGSTTASPNYKNMEKVQDGVTNSNLVWKINDQGILTMNLYNADPKALIDSLTTSRLVYIQYNSLQPLNGTRYYLHK